MIRDWSLRLFLRAARRYAPGLQLADLAWGPSGIRAQALRRNGSLVEDFAIARGTHVVHVLNAPSPAATASLAIGREVAAQAVIHLGI
jgi:L-2-hydroxyglutarate oxidase LhgO